MSLATYFSRLLSPRRRRIDEASLSRVWQHATGRRFAILTAFRGEYSRDENLQRNRELANAVRAFGAGFWLLDGYWVEQPGVEVKEDSLFISLPAESKEDLRGFILTQMRKFQQEAAVLRDDPSGPVQLLFPDGGDTEIGAFSPGKVAQAYSKLRGSGQTFVFESAEPPLGWGGTMAQRRNT